MDIQQTLTIMGMIITMAISAAALYKVARLAPKEIKAAEVSLSTGALDLADKALARANAAEKQIREMENTVVQYEATIKEMSTKIDNLDTTAINHEAEIKALKEKMAEKELELAQLRKKIIAQDAEIIDLKKALQDRA